MLCLTAFLLVSCEGDKVVFDSKNGTSVASLRTSAADLPVSDQGDSFATILVDVTTVSDVDRAIVLSIDETSTADENQYIIDQSSLIIPAGSYNATVKINGNFDNLPLGQTSKLDLTLASVDGAVISEGKSSISVSLYRTCDVASTFLTGNYLLEEITPLVDGPTLESGSVRTISVDPADPSKRVFTTYTFPDYCTTNRVTFKFSLLCGEIVIPTGNVSNCTCTADPFLFGPPTTNGTYDSSDDSVVYLSFTNDVTGNCSPASQTTYKLTKQ